MIARTVVQVTREHIERGVKFSPRSCPIAWALRAAGFEHAEVASEFFTCSNKPGNWIMRGPVRIFMHRFDDGAVVRPFAFEVEPIAARAGAKVGAR